MFTQTVGMTASDWPVSHVVKTSQTIDLNLASLSFFTGIAVSGLILRLKAKEVCSDPDFKASLGWYQKWKKRHSISLRTKTTLAQRLPQDLEEKTVQFHRFVIALRQRYGHSLSRLFNMDETPMRFELPSSRTLEFSGSRTVPVKSCGAEKRSFTVTLAVAADGQKLPPSVIFKGVRTPRDLAVPDSVRVSFHKKGWMDEKGKNLSHFISKLTGNWCYAQMTDRRILSIYSNWVFCYLFQERRSGFVPVCQGILAMNGHCLFGILSEPI